MHPRFDSANLPYEHQHELSIHGIEDISMRRRSISMASWVLEVMLSTKILRKVIDKLDWIGLGVPGSSIGLGEMCVT